MLDTQNFPSYIETGKTLSLSVTAEKGENVSRLALYRNGKESKALSEKPFVFSHTASETGSQLITARAFMKDGTEIEFSNQLHFTVIDTDIAKNMNSTASSFENAAYISNNAFDHDGFTRWASSFSDPQWLTVDLGDVQTIDAVTLCWEAAYAVDYGIRVSLDGENWLTVYECTEGTGGTEQNQFPPVKTRYVQMYGKKRSTQWGYSLWDMFVHKK